LATDQPPTTRQIDEFNSLQEDGLQGVAASIVERQYPFPLASTGVNGEAPALETEGTRSNGVKAIAIGLEAERNCFRVKQFLFGICGCLHHQ
jgi:hypothetical protein